MFADELGFCDENNVHNLIDSQLILNTSTNNATPVESDNGEKSSDNAKSVEVRLGEPGGMDHGKPDGVHEKPGGVDQGKLVPSLKKFNSLFKGNRNPSSGMKLEFVPAAKSASVIQFEFDDMEGEIEIWENALVGFEIGGNPTVENLEHFVKANWNHVVKPKILLHRKGWFFFKFHSREDRDLILKGGPWVMGQKTLLLKPWSPDFCIKNVKVSRVPIWIQLPGLDVQYWSVKGLSKIASKIGTPMYADRCTAAKERISYVRILVEVDLVEDLPHTIPICTPFGVQLTQKSFINGFHTNVTSVEGSGM